MHRLVYLSDAVGDLSAKDIARIVECSRRNNARAGVTGLLLYHEGRFFQEIEGQRPAVAQVFRHIRNDPRHTNITVLEFGPAQARAFEDWALGWDHPEALPESLRRSAFSIFDLMNPEAPGRGARPKVRDQVRGFLAGFRWLRAAGDTRPWF